MVYVQLDSVPLHDSRMSGRAPQDEGRLEVSVNHGPEARDPCSLDPMIDAFTRRRVTWQPTARRRGYVEGPDLCSRMGTPRRMEEPTRIQQLRYETRTKSHMNLGKKGQMAMLHDAGEGFLGIACRSSLCISRENLVPDL